MGEETYISYRADDRSYFSTLKREIRLFAESEGMDTLRLANLDIVLSEMTSNLTKYGKDGEILVGIFEGNGARYLELICLDRGSGIADIERTMVDGFSTGKSMGIGLGSIKRLSDYFEIYSQKDWGTIILSRLNIGRALEPAIPGVTIKSLVVKMPGETKSGDGTYYQLLGKYLFLLVADGLGHGVLAHDAVTEAIAVFQNSSSTLAEQRIRLMHEAIKKTRGIVATVGVLNLETKQWNMAGVGNISCKFSNYLKAKSIIPYNGIIGHTIPNTINSQQIDALAYPQLVLCSDGIRSKWELGKFPAIARYDLSVQAAALYKDYGRQTDDMSVVIIKTF